VVLDAEGLETRIPLPARQLVAIHSVRPAEQLRGYVALTTAETVVVPRGADAGVWAAAIDVIREPAPPSRGRFLHRDFQPGNVLFDVPPSGSKEARIVGVVDWAAASWGPADLDVAHCATNLALLHGPAWGLRIAVGHRLGRAQRPRSPRRTRRPTGCWRRPRASGCTGRSGRAGVLGRSAVGGTAWREAGRVELTTRAVEERLDAYVTALLETLG
jgi:hypothetical protein